MSQYILVIENDGRIEPVCHEALGDTDLKIVSAPDFVTAKRKLLQAIPAIILCPLSLGGEADAGLKFCNELRGHESFADIPVLLFSEKMDEAKIRAACGSGATAGAPWPIAAAALRSRISKLVPDVVSSAAAAKLDIIQDSADDEEVQDEKNALFAMVDEDDIEEKFKIAQRVFAKVLHSIKTSNVLEFADAEDIPRILVEMTRSVCGISEPEQKK